MTFHSAGEEKLLCGGRGRVLCPEYHFTGKRGIQKNRIFSEEKYSFDSRIVLLPKF
jgi:hypothetical protein